MHLFTRDMRASVRPFAAFTAACCVCLAVGCSADAGGGADAPAVTGTTDEALVGGHTSLPWRGFPQDGAPPFTNGNEVIYGADLGISSSCIGGVCENVLSGLQLFYYNTVTGSTRSSIVGKSKAHSWTRELCPSNAFVSGYNIATDAFGIGNFGLRCMTLTRATTSLPVLGGGKALFHEILDCTPFTNSIVSFTDNIFMNNEGNGIGANCDQT